MPYSKNSELPDAVKNKLSAEEQTKWRKVFNSAMKEYEDETKAFAVAWSSVQKTAKLQKTADPREGENMEIDWRREFEIRKTEEDKQLVFGWLSVAVDESGETIIDKQGDIIEPEELEKTAYDFVLYARSAGEMHKNEIGRLVESMVFTIEKQEVLGIPKGILPEAGWWCGFKIDDSNAWMKVKDKTYSAFSLGGKAIREEI